MVCQSLSRVIRADSCQSSAVNYTTTVRQMASSATTANPKASAAATEENQPSANGSPKTVVAVSAPICGVP
jgi:hypothetical protein